MKELKSAIENLYDTFGKYTTEGIHHCDCGCIDEEDVLKLNSKPLRQLEEDDLIAYHGSALYTWGDVAHYKHFLPRICELLARHEFSYVHIDELYNKLEYAEWTNWPANEIQAMKDFVIADWFDIVNNKNSEISDTLLADYGKFFDMQTLVNLWKVSSGDFALRNFVYFFYFHGSQILTGEFKIESKICEKEFNQLLESRDILQKLESKFFEHEKKDTDYADKISIVLQMIEQEIKVKNLRK